MRRVGPLPCLLLPGPPPPSQPRACTDTALGPRFRAPAAGLDASFPFRRRQSSRGALRGSASTHASLVLSRAGWPGEGTRSPSFVVEIRLPDLSPIPWISYLPCLERINSAIGY